MSSWLVIKDRLYTNFLAAWTNNEICIDDKNDDGTLLPHILINHVFQPGGIWCRQSFVWTFKICHIRCEYILENKMCICKIIGWDRDKINCEVKSISVWFYSYFFMFTHILRVSFILFFTGIGGDLLVTKFEFFW